ncbi:MAG: hypothetical protein GY737_17390 [Desulfobacteraceae bacterium]|nr:hypothetical protein [Desulfobacteraceae bacterium]
MKNLLVAITIIISVGIAIFAITNLKGKEQIIQARYLRLACEGCFHMEVERSTDAALINTTIIPRSNKIDVEQLINNALETNRKIFCLKGRKKLFNLNVFNIDPNGIIFFIDEALPLAQCDEIKL